MEGVVMLMGYRISVGGEEYAVELVDWVAL